jgi:hypothetical protein
MPKGETYWFGEYEYCWFTNKGEEELWLHCPKANGNEKAWRKECEIVQDAEQLAALKLSMTEEIEQRAARSQKWTEEGAERILKFMGCITWDQFRTLCFKEGQKQTVDGKSPCYAC